MPPFGLVFKPSGTGNVVAGGNLSAYGIVVGNGGNNIGIITPSSSTYSFVSQGASAIPGFQIDPVTGGGTGQSVLPSHAVLLGNGSSALTTAPPTGSGAVFQSNGTGVDPSFGNNINLPTNGQFQSGSGPAIMPSGIAIPSGVNTLTLTGTPTAARTLTLPDVTDILSVVSTSKSNLLTNGGFEIWQRGAGAFTANNAYTADRWFINYTPASGTTISVTQETNAAFLDIGSQSSLKAVVSYNNSSAFIVQELKDLSAKQYKGAVVTFTCRVNASVGSSVNIGIQDGTNNQYSGVSSVTNSFVTYSITKTLIPDSTVINFVIQLFGTGTFYIDNAMVTFGQQSVPYIPLHPADEWNRCLRYYEILTADCIYFAYMQVYSTTQALGFLNYEVPKSVTPTISFSATGDFALLDSSGASHTCTVLNGSNSIGKTRCRLDATVASGLTAGQLSILIRNVTTAQLIIEANP